MKTSSFRHSANDPGAVSIARKPPWWYNGRSYPLLFPPEDLLREYRDELITWEEYEDRYLCTVLGPLDAQKVFDELTAIAAPHEAVALCWELPNAPYSADPYALRCHRRTAARWLELRLNIVIPEVTLADAAAAGTAVGPLFRT